MAYNKTDAAESLGISKDELKRRAKAAGFSDTESYYNFIGGAAAPIIEQIKNQIIELDREYAELLPGVHLTDEELDNFLNKAIAQVEPYYNRKMQEIEAGIREGSLRTAEDVLLFTRDTENEVRSTLEGLDLKTAETEEDFLNKIANITSTRDEDIAAKREDWRLRLENLKMGQIQAGIFSSGIGKKKREEAQRLEDMELGEIAARAGRQQTEAETAKKYTLDQVRLARETAERERMARIGAPATQEALGTLGYSDLSQLPSKSEIEMARASSSRNISTYKPEALRSLEEERLKAAESRKLELQQEELTLREQERERQRQKILADKAAAQSRISAYRSY